ncbi:Ubiquitin carboxyl-terminal hydrolase 12 [Cercospora beticola]|uniref:ubiquitinyl hydrolase 1 n=2 Tax=Cercospora beticola TaxID=122368 RepID=A0A2G5HQC8_CERBT|nr:Ubiquitin carboxyl-terminal hydrolase 12 [Cercospora beticola]PIA94728.1 Ubiquitin carboxyl-terminal hydrolase 12 [Cercospora beticola]
MEERAVVSPGRTIGGGRSMSPAKRTAEEMEGAKKQTTSSAVVTAADAAPASVNAAPPSPGSFPKEGEETGQASDFDVAMTEMQESSAGKVQSTNGSTSADDEELPPYSKEDQGVHAKGADAYTTEQITQQVDHVRTLAARAPAEGDVGVCISNKWLVRVLSRTAEGLQNKEYPKEAREGPVGPLDNSDIVPEGGFEEPHLHDAHGKHFIPLRPGLRPDDEFTILPASAYGDIAANYGSTSGQIAIYRYAHNTADADAAGENVQYELYPPIVTIRKVQQPDAEEQEKPKQKPGATATEALKARREGREKFGQKHETDALRIVSSRSEKYKSFLTRAKNAAGIPIATKVKVWRLKDPAQVAVDQPNTTSSGAMAITPPASRSASPAKSVLPKLVLPPEDFKKMEVGTELEQVPLADQTHNDNFNGRSTMNTAGFFEDSTMLLEEQIGGPAGGEFQSDSKKGVLSVVNKNLGSKATTANNSRASSPAPGGMMTRGRALKNGKTRGTVGLQNLGNTCYMNSALQCIRSVEELAIYFMLKSYKPEINNDNPLGYHGAMANAYHTVIQGIYGNNTGGSFSPREFKNTLGRHQPMFSGYGQQDSQEFLSFLVDAIHEDLNRIHKKPYVENPDSEDSKVHDPSYIHELGEQYRTNHKKRNDSIAMDLFSGFYKNKMECPECDKVSITFDPYSLVTVQLPMEIAFQHDITYIPLRGRPVLHHIDIDKNASIKTLKESLAKKHPGADANRMWMVEIYQHKVYKIFDDGSSLSEHSITGNDNIFVYELEQVPKNPARKSYHYGNAVNAVPTDGMDAPQAEVFSVPVFQRTPDRSLTSYSLANYPLYITVSREEAKDYDIVLKKVLAAVANTTSRQILKEFEEDPGASRVEEVEDEDQDQNGSEESVGVSDHSAQSEEGYVKVSLDQHSHDAMMTNGTTVDETEKASEVYIPTNYMDPNYYVSPALRHQLFDLKFGQGKGGMHCSDGMQSGVKEDTIRPMFSRVKRSSRRSSMHSSSSSAGSTPGTPSTDGQADEESVAVSNGFEGDEPDITLGDADAATPLSESVIEDSSDDETAGGDIIMEPSEVTATSRKGRRKKNRGKKQKGKKRGANQNGVGTTSKKGKPRAGLPAISNGSSGLFGSKQADDDDNPYYIRLGEGIVLDWKAEGFDSLYGGSANVEKDLRGHATCDDNGRRGIKVFEDPEQDAKKAKRELRKKKGVLLDDCFDVTSRPEVLSEDNAWYCNRCKELRRATKTLEIWTLPDILVVHLKRFGGNRSFRDKIDLFVDYPITGLDMNERVGRKEDGKDYTYDLFAVDNHYGGLGGGHYTAMAKNFYDGEWYDYNDSMTSKIGGEDRVHSAAAYLLFYRRRSDQPLGPEYLQNLVNEYRNPAAPAEEAEDEESGEGKLGGRTLSGSGSSSGLAGAGAGANKNNSSQRGLLSADGGIGAAAEGRLITRTTGTKGNAATTASGFNLSRDAGWSFDAIDGDDGADADAADSFLQSVGAASDGADSVSGQVGDDDDDSGMDMDVGHPTLQSLAAGEEDLYGSSGDAGRNTPARDVHFDATHGISLTDDDMGDDDTMADEIHLESDDGMELEEIGRGTTKGTSEHHETPDLYD